MQPEDGAWESLNRSVVACVRCPRLVAWRELTAVQKRRAYRNSEYWGKPVQGFGDRRASLLILGLAPGAHGANRTGRVFTGDRSGDFLFAALNRAGYANQSTSCHRGDGLELRDAYIAAAVRCAPPANRPTPEEANNCQPFLQTEWDLLFPTLKVAVALGHFALRALWLLLRDRGVVPPRLTPVHSGVFDLGPGLPALIFSYHPSQQNTQTGRLTPEMMDRVFQASRYLVRE